MTSDSFGARGTLTVGDGQYQVWQLAPLADIGDITRLPYSIKILLENLVRHEIGLRVRRFKRWTPTSRDSCWQAIALIIASNTLGKRGAEN